MQVWVEGIGGWVCEQESGVHTEDQLLSHWIGSVGLKHCFYFKCSYTFNSDLTRCRKSLISDGS